MRITLSLLSCVILCCSAPMVVYESGVVVFSSCFGNPDFVAIDPTGSGDVTECHIKWRAGQALPTSLRIFVSVHGERSLAQFFGKLMENPPLKVPENLCLTPSNCG